MTSVLRKLAGILVVAAATSVPPVGEIAAPPRDRVVAPPTACEALLLDAGGLGLPPGEEVLDHRNQTRDLDSGTVAAVLALAPKLSEPFRIEDVANTTTHRFLACRYEVAGIPNLQRLLVIEERHERNVWLDSKTAIAALALNKTGAPLRLDEILTIREAKETRVHRDEMVDFERSCTELACVLGDP